MAKEIYKVTAGDQTFKVQRHGLDDRLALVAEFKRLVPSPVDELGKAAAKFIPAVAEAFVTNRFEAAFREEKENYPPAFPRRDFVRPIISDPDSFALLLHLALTPHQPKTTRKQCLDLVKAAYGDQPLDDALGEITVRFLLGETPAEMSVADVWEYYGDRNGADEISRQWLALAETEGLLQDPTATESTPVVKEA